MSLRKLYLSTLLMCLAFSGFAQFSKTVHNSFEADSAQTIVIDVAGDVAVETWDGNTVLVETHIKLYNASKGIFEYFVERAGRYDVLEELSGTQLRIYSKDSERKIIQTKHGQSSEEVNVVVMIPRRFVGEGTGPFQSQEVTSGR